jgi:hypothetical protein
MRQEYAMPSNRPSRPRRTVVALVAVLLTLGSALGMALGSPGRATAVPRTEGSAPILTLPAEVIFVLGRVGDSYGIEAAGDPVPALGVEGLPAGLRLVAHGDGSATIEGRPAGPAGSTTVEVTAQNSAGSTTEDLVVSVHQAPAFAHRGPLTFVAGEFASTVLQPSGFPAPGIDLQGDLPAGLTFVDNGDGSATIAGTPLGGRAEAPVTLTAVNEVADTALTTTVAVVIRADVTGGPVVVVRGAGPRREP